MKPVVRLVCWNAELAPERARLIEASGFSANASPINPGGVIGQFRDEAPAAVLIDLDKRPSHGFEVAAALRNSKSVRHIPIVFAGGAEEKVERVRRELPDALFTDWKRLAPALRKALRGAPAEPVRPTPHMDRYAGSPLPRKLGLKPRMTVALLSPPEGFEETLGEELDFQTRITPQTSLALWFVRSRRELDGTGYLAARLPEGCSIWIIHPKQAGRFRVDFNQNDVRAAGLSAGLVDYKVCAVDADWSGLKFARAKSPASPRTRSRADSRPAARQ